MLDGRILAGLAVAAVVTALVTGNTLILRLAYVLCTVLAVTAAVTWTSVRGVTISRRTPSRRSQVGGWAEESLRVENRSWLPKLWLEIRDEGDLPGHHASRAVSTLMPGQGHNWVVRSRCRQRGMFTLGPMALAGGDPLGLFRVERVLDQTVPFIVYPLTVPLRGFEMPTGYLSGGHVINRRAEFTTANIRGVRNYQPGDAFNRIHWRTTARRGRLYTKEFEVDPLADFWLLLDLDRQVHVGETPDSAAEEGTLPWLQHEEATIDPTTEEYAVTAAASLGRHFLDQGKSVGLIAHGQRRLVINPDRGDRQVAKLLAGLAVLRAAGRASLAEVLSTENHEFTRHTTLVTITPTTAVRWVDALRELRHRGVASLVIVIEANTFGPGPSSQPLLTALTAHNIPTWSVRCGQDLAGALTGHGGTGARAELWRAPYWSGANSRAGQPVSAGR
jgi:uncharacterized protein (DUF58 family)